MKIAVLMSTYNGGKFLDRQLESLAKQTVKNDMTIYIRDDKSSDQTLSIIEQWKEKIDIVVYAEDNVGPAMSFWTLMSRNEIQADYYAFCDQDDVWDENKLEVAIKHLSGDVHFYACNCRIIDENGIVINETQNEVPPAINIPRLYVCGVTQGCSMVFTDSLRKYINEKKITKIPMHDIVVMLYAMQFGKIYWDNTPRFGYRMHSNNVVAKENKSIFKKLKTTYWNWMNGKKNSMSDVAQEMIQNCSDMNEKDKEYLLAVANYKKSIVNKIKILCNKQTKESERKALRSYRIRIIMNIY